MDRNNYQKGKVTRVVRDTNTTTKNLENPKNITFTTKFNVENNEVKDFLRNSERDIYTLKQNIKAFMLSKSEWQNGDGRKNFWRKFLEQVPDQLIQLFIDSYLSSDNKLDFLRFYS